MTQRSGPVRGAIVPEFVHQSTTSETERIANSLIDYPNLFLDNWPPVNRLTYASTGR